MKNDDATHTMAPPRPIFRPTGTRVGRAAPPLPKRPPSAPPTWLADRNVTVGPRIGAPPPGYARARDGASASPKKHVSFRFEQ